NDYADGRATQEFTAAVIPGLRFGGGALTAFWTFAENRGDTGALMVTLGPFLPPDFKPGRFKGQGWADRLQRTHHYGLIGHIDIAPDWRLSGGAFETRSTRRRSYVDLFLDVAPDGSAQNIMIAEPPLPARWTSGEAQIIWSPKSDALAHQFTMSLRVRDKKLEQGGGGSALLGPARIGVANPARQPNFTFQPTTSNSVTQWSPGIAYIGRWRRLAEVNASVQKSSYRQTVSRNGISARTDADALLYNIAVALQPTSWLTVYGGHVKGLEETAAPPQFASNRDDTPPASQTRQWDAGIRLSFGDTRLVAGVFETTRPYFATNSANFYTRLGERRNRGVELSVVA
ncbi:MAG: TonB-dependent receptor domain-containing protein, partial [Sphingopyxis sp.]